MSRSDAHRYHEPSEHDHIHGVDCGHRAVTHEDHLDYLHDGTLARVARRALRRTHRPGPLAATRSRLYPGRKSNNGTAINGFELQRSRCRSRTALPWPDHRQTALAAAARVDLAARSTSTGTKSRIGLPANRWWEACTVSWMTSGATSGKDTVRRCATSVTARVSSSFDIMRMMLPPRTTGANTGHRPVTPRSSPGNTTASRSSGLQIIDPAGRVRSGVRGSAQFSGVEQPVGETVLIGVGRDAGGDPP